MSSLTILSSNLFEHSTKENVKTVSAGQHDVEERTIYHIFSMGVSKMTKEQADEIDKKGGFNMQSAKTGLIVPFIYRSYIEQNGIWIYTNNTNINDFIKDEQLRCIALIHNDL